MADRQQLRLVLTLGVGQTIAWGSTFYLPAILAAPMAGDLGLGVSAVFTAFSAALLVSAVLGPWAGRWIDRFGGRGMLVASTLIFAAGLGILAAAQGWWTLLAAWMVLGVGMACGLYEAAFATLAAIQGTKARASISGITVIAGFASTVAWPLTAWLEGALGWRGSCLAWVVVLLALALPLALSLPRGRAPLPPRPQAKLHGSPDRTMLLLGFTFATMWFVSTAMAAHLPRLLESAGATPVAALAAAALVGPAQVAARLMEFGLLRRADPMIAARLAAVAHPVGAALLLVLGAPVAAAFTVLHGAGNGILTIARGTVPLALYGAEGYGARQGWLAAPARLAAVAAPGSFAVLIETFGAGALWVSMALGLASLVALMAIRVPRP